MEVQTVCVKKRTLRRKQRALIIKDYLHDMEIVENLLINATTPLAEFAYQRLSDILYKGYCELVDSEV